MPARLGGGACDIVDELMLVCEEREPVRLDRRGLLNQASSDRKLPHSDAGDGGAATVLRAATAVERVYAEARHPPLAGHVQNSASASRPWVVHVIEPIIATVGAAELPAFVWSINGVLRDTDGTLCVRAKFNCGTRRRRIAGFIWPDA